MKDDEIIKAMAGMDACMAEEERRTAPPRCHCTPMLLSKAEEESWWECKHCGHTRLIETHPTY